MRAAELLDPDPRDLALMRGYPQIPWLEPLPVWGGPGVVKRYACRICVGRYGLHSRDVAQLDDDPDEVLEHLRAFHHLDAS